MSLQEACLKDIRMKVVTTEVFQICLRSVNYAQCCGAGRWGDEGQWRLGGDTYMGKSDFPESSVIILYLHLLHERTDD